MPRVPSFELEQLVGHCGRQPLDLGDAITGNGDPADLLAGGGRRLVRAHELIEGVADLLRAGRLVPSWASPRHGVRPIHLGRTPPRLSFAASRLVAPLHLVALLLRLSFAASLVAPLHLVALRLDSASLRLGSLLLFIWSTPPRLRFAASRSLLRILTARPSRMSSSAIPGRQSAVDDSSHCRFDPADQVRSTMMFSRTGPPACAVSAFSSPVPGVPRSWGCHAHGRQPRAGALAPASSPIGSMAPSSRRSREVSTAR